MRGDIASYNRIYDLINPAYKNEFWTAVNRSGNFFKHANKDPTAIHEMDEEETDFVIMFATRWYCDLGFSPTPEMKAFMMWFGVCHPDMVIPDVRASLAEATAPFRTMSDERKPLPRSDRLNVGQMLLKQELRAVAT